MKLCALCRERLLVQHFGKRLRLMESPGPGVCGRCGGQRYVAATALEDKPGGRERP